MSQPSLCLHRRKRSGRRGFEFAARRYRAEIPFRCSCIKSLSDPGCRRFRCDRILPMRAFLLGFIFTALLPAAKTLDVYFIDVEGGQATLMVSPSGQSMLVDTGWAGFNNRDADRIAGAAQLAGVKQIDYLVITHFHADHVGGVPQLAAKIPIKHFVDHGPNMETGANADALYSAYKSAWGSGKHITVKPGDKIPVKGLDVEVLSANG